MSTETACDKLVGFFSYKGGVGRTLVLCNTALALLQRLRSPTGEEYGVFCVDLDLPAPGILPIFGVSAKEQRVFHFIFKGPGLGQSLKTKATQLELDRPVPIRVLAEEFPDPAAIEYLTSLFYYPNANAESGGSSVQVVLNYFKDRGRIDFLAPFTLIDLGAGYGPLPEHAFRELDHLVVVVRADRQHRKALPGFLKLLDNASKNNVSRLSNIHTVLNQVPKRWVTNPIEREDFMTESGLKAFMEQDVEQRRTFQVAPILEAALTGETVFLPEEWSYSDSGTSEKAGMAISPRSKDETLFREAIDSLAQHLIGGND